MGVTRPYSKIHHSQGEGIEWHSDGGKGEYTMIIYIGDGTEINMSNCDGIKSTSNNNNKNDGKNNIMSNDLGCLKVIPNSHNDFDSVGGTGHGDIDSKQCELRCDVTSTHYYYQYYTPIIFDARLLHCGCSNSHPTKWRNIIWYIFDSY